MKTWYYIDPEVELPHIYRRSVSESEVEEVLGELEKIGRGAKDRG